MESLPTLDRIIDRTPHRYLEDIDLKVIFQYKSFWSLYYASILVTGLRPIDLAMLIDWNLERERNVIQYYTQGSNDYRETAVPPRFLALFKEGKSDTDPLFPALFSEIDHTEYRLDELNEKLGPASDFLESLLIAAGRPVASLMALKVTHDAVQKGANYAFHQIIISRVNSSTGVFELPQS